jgi:hypothetical protein
MGKEIVHALIFEEHKKGPANKTVFELSVFRKSLINDFVKDRTKGKNPLGEYAKDPLEGAKENLSFTTEEVLPIFKDYFRLIGKRFDLGHASLGFAGESAIFYDPELDSLAYSFAPGRRPAVLSDDILDRLYNARINPVAVETFGSFSKIQLIDEVMLAIKHPTLKNVKDSLQRV